MRSTNTFPKSWRKASRWVPAAAAVAGGLLSSSSAHAGFAFRISFDDTGLSTKTVGAADVGTVYKVSLYGDITGTGNPNTSAYDGLAFAIANLSSSQLNGGLLGSGGVIGTGHIKQNAKDAVPTYPELSPFDPPSETTGQSIQTITADGILDWGSTAANLNQPQPDGYMTARTALAGGAPVYGGFGTGTTIGTTGWEFKLATFSISVGSLLAGANNRATKFVVSQPAALSNGAGTAVDITYYQDQANGTGNPVLVSPNTAASAAIFGLAAVEFDPTSVAGPSATAIFNGNSAPAGYSAFTGTQNGPGGTGSTITVTGHYLPGYLNNLATNNGKGYVMVQGIATGDEEVIALDFQVNHGTGLVDPTAAEETAIVALLNASSGGLYTAMTAAQEAALSATTAALFPGYDIFLDPNTLTNPNFVGIDLSQLNGLVAGSGTITGAQMNNIGAVPEPAMAALIAAPALLLAGRRRRKA